jgi:hypothetical protein
VTDSNTDNTTTHPDNRVIIAAIMEHEGVDEREATHRMLERMRGQLRPNSPEHTATAAAAERIPALRIASEILHASCDEYLVPLEGLPAGTKDDLDYRGPYAMAELLTAIADHVDAMPAPVLAWAITLAEAVVEGEQDFTRCRFCRCTEDRACTGGCGWATDEQLREAGIEPMEGDVCTACVAKAEAGLLVVTPT